jgi:small GTP-binding protein
MKCVVGGDGVIGKRCLLQNYMITAFPGESIPTSLDDYSAIVTVEDQQIDLQLWNTAGQEDYKKLRPLSYPQTDVFVICFSLVAPTSLENVQNMWVPEIMEHCPTTPYILVGLKSDLRDEFDQHADEYKSMGWGPVPASKGEEMKKAINAQSYIECSASTQYNLKEVFEAAIKAALHPPAAAPAKVKVKKGGVDGGCEVAET